jgi:hypothetical protein
MRAELAPSAVRTATSRRRAAARASCRLARLAHAIKRTRPTVPSRTSSAGRRLPYRRSWSVSTRTLSFVSISFGNAFRYCVATTSISACAFRSVTPSLSRAEISR